MMNILFLDLDGVMVPQSSTIKTQPADQFGAGFSEVAIVALQSIIDQCKAHIVLTSSWRFQGINTMQQMWESRHLPGKIYAITSIHAADEAIVQGATSAQCRAIEIKEWLQRHPNVNYAILDDEPITDAAIIEHLIITNPTTGLDHDKANKVICIFQRTPDAISTQN